MTRFTLTHFDGEPRDPSFVDRVVRSVRDLSDADLAEYCRYWTWRVNRFKAAGRGWDAWKASIRLSSGYAEVEGRHLDREALAASISMALITGGATQGATGILRRHSSGPVTQVSRYVEACFALNLDAVRAEYASRIATAPTRAQPYIVEHNISGRAAESTRLEELLAHRMFLEQTVLVVPDWPPVQVVDFQTPLKAKQTDKHGKVDLLAAGVGLTVIELKVLRGTQDADTPLNALLEAVGYCAIVEANQERIVDELRARGHTVAPGGVSALVLAPDDYWARWDRTRTKQPWRKALSVAVDVIIDATGLPVGFGSFDVDEVGATLEVTDPLE